MLSSYRRHITHLICFFLFIFVFEILAGGITIESQYTSKYTITNPTETYGLTLSIIIYFIRLLSLSSDLAYANFRP